MRIGQLLKKNIRFMKMADVDNKAIYWILFFGPVASCVVPYVHIYFYAKILDYMLEGQLQAAVINMLWLVGLTFVCKYVRFFMDKGCDEDTYSGKIPREEATLVQGFRTPAVCDTTSEPSTGNG